MTIAAHGYRNKEIAPGALTVMEPRQVRWGPFPPSGKTLSADFMSIYRITDKWIAEARGQWDSSDR
jgi:hypothetical protein